MRKLGLLALAALVVSSPVLAKTHVSFAAYEGTGSDVITGKGGTKIADHGIDFWTTGDPPRAFHYLGALTVVGGNPIGNKAVAEAVKKAGGNAAVLKKSETHSSGVRGMGPIGGAPGWVREDHETTSVLAVVRYAE